MLRIEEIDSQNYYLYKNMQITVEQARMMGDTRKEPITFYPMNIMAQYPFQYEKPVLLGFIDDTIPVGFCSYVFMPEFKMNIIDYKNGYVISSFMIDKNHQSKGYGTNALKLLIEHIKQNHNVDTIYLGVDANNFPAKNLYLKCGFILDDYSKEHENDDINLMMKYAV